MIGEGLLLAVDVTSVPPGVPQGDRVYALLLGIAAILAPLGGLVSAVVIGRRRADEDSAPVLRRKSRAQNRLIVRLRADLMAMTRAYYAAVGLAKSKGARDDEIPAEPVLTSGQPDPDDDEDAL